MPAFLPILYHLLIVSTAINACFGEEELQYTDVKLPENVTIRGVVKAAPNGRVVSEFLGVPYAEPPVGHLRFKAPVAKNYSSSANAGRVINATRYGPSCIQAVGPMPLPLINKWWTPEIMQRMSEDCLYLNVWVPDDLRKNMTETIDSWPVMVWIHGGGFFAGSTVVPTYDGQILAAEERVIVVSMNYRLTVFGFLTTGGHQPEMTTGNAGLLDQLMALKWVNERIGRFGGDPRRVTLFGESAGAVSAGLHALSPTSRPYFQRVVMQSGAPNSPWAFSHKGEMLKRSKQFAASLDCLPPNNNTNIEKDEAVKVGDDDDSSEFWQQMVECLVGKSAMDLLTKSFLTNVHPSTVAWGPTDDGHFLTDSPVELLKNGHLEGVEILIGTNSHEINMFLPIYAPQIYPMDRIYETDRLMVSPEMLKMTIEAMLPPQMQIHLLIEALHFEYNEWTSLPFDPSSGPRSLERLFSDYQFHCPANLVAQAFVQRNSSVYMYHFEHHSDQHTTPSWMGAVHSDEIPFVFGIPLNTERYNYTTEERQLSKRMMKLWANFARTGNPNLRPNGQYMKWWHNFGINEYYLNLNLNLKNVLPPPPAIRHSFRRRQCVFWYQYLPEIVKFLMNLASNQNLE